jgi:type II secretory pathway pseudopilin PulG
MSGGVRRPQSAEAGFTLVALIASMSIMMILMAVGTRSWQYVMQNDREEELLFRGGQIADAIQRYQLKHGNTSPPNLEALVKGRFLRKVYKDPMSPKGDWRLIRPGEPLVPIPQPSPRGRSSQPPISRPPRPGVMTQEGLGAAVIGVASKSTQKSLRVFNGRKRYDEWIFAPGQPRVVGRMSIVPVLPGQAGPSGQTGPAGQPRPPRQPGSGSP